MFSALYGPCRSINNATLAEVKEACGSIEGVEKEEKDIVGDKENEEMGAWRRKDGTSRRRWR